MQTATLGKTGRVVTRVGLGGVGVLRTRGRAPEAVAVIEAALAAGLTYFDCARAYEDAERYHGAVWGKRAAAREGVFLASKSAERAAGPARRQLEETLARMQVDHLDLWQIHDVRTLDELDELEAPGGALEAFVAARQAGLVRHIGVTGHHDPAVTTRAVETLPVDTVLLPVNPMEGVLGGYMTETIPAARARGIGVIGMKALGGAAGPAGAWLVQAGFGADELLGYALAQAVDVLVVGCATPAEVAALAAARPLEAAAQAALRDRMRPRARELAAYRGVIA
jgi:aryl-alcohol dehydrogenase-like predicted oxidoreductase